MTDDGDLPVELIDAAGSSTRTVELRPRRRGRELLLVAAGVAVVIGVGLIDDGGDGDAGAAPTTTTSARRPATTRDETPATTRQRSAASPPSTRGSTTTTTWPQFEAGTGPLLPGEPTGAHVGIIDGQHGRVHVLDLDTGDRCVTLPSPNGTWVPWSLQGWAGQMLVQTNASLLFVDRQCATTPLDLDFRDRYPVAMTQDRVWVSDHRSPYVNELVFPSGEPTGRTIDIPRFNPPAVFAVGDDLLLGTMGDMTVVDPTTGRRASLGTGTPLAVHGTVVAYSACPEARCRLGLLDVETGRRSRFDDIEPVTWNQSAFSPDGRHLRISVPGARSDQPLPAIVDVTTGSVRILDEIIQQAAFTADSRWLIASTDRRLMAFNVDGSFEDIQLDESFSGSQGLALL